MLINVLIGMGRLFGICFIVFFAGFAMAVFADGVEAIRDMLGRR